MLIISYHKAQFEGFFLNRERILHHKTFHHLSVVTANSLSPSDDFHNQHHQPLHQSTELFNSIDGLFDCYSEKLRIINLSDRRFCGPLAHVKYSQQVNCFRRLTIRNFIYNFFSVCQKFIEEIFISLPF